MKLDKLHVDQFRAGVIGQDNAVPGGFPTVARNLKGASNPAGRKHDRFRAKDFESAPFAFVTKRADRAIPIFQDR